MTGRVVSMEKRLALMAAADLPGVQVKALCDELGVSRQTFYKLQRRFTAEGLAGLEPRSRRPHTSPGQISAELEDEIVRLRKTLPLDNGAQAIVYELARGGGPVPAATTVHRALVRRGLVVPQPQKRPKKHDRRFEYSAPNECWQIDATHWELADGQLSWIMNILDDHSRACPASEVGDGPDGELAWAAFSAGAAEYGLPQRVLSDNGLCFSTARRPGMRPCDFEANLAALGVHTITSTPYHPQTCGKVERFHQMQKKWLARQPPAENNLQLRCQLGCFRVYYNDERPHGSLGGAVPSQRWRALPPACPGAPYQPDQPPPVLDIRPGVANHLGILSVGYHLIHIGAEWAGRPVTVLRYGQRVAILDGATPIRSLEIDPTRRYQASGLPRGAAGRDRIKSLN